MKGFLINLLFILTGSFIILFTFDIDLKNTVNWLLWLIGLSLVNLGGALSKTE